jgi:hypothetical protein
MLHLGQLDARVPEALSRPQYCARDHLQMDARAADELAAARWPIPIAAIMHATAWLSSGALLASVFFYWVWNEHSEGASGSDWNRE